MPGAVRLMEYLSRVPDGIQPEHLHAVPPCNTKFKQTSSSPDLPAVSQRQIQACARSRRGRCFHPELGLQIGTDGFDGQACMLFASIRKVKRFARRFSQSTSYAQKLSSVDPARQCICILLSSEEAAASRVVFGI